MDGEGVLCPRGMAALGPRGPRREPPCYLPPLPARTGAAQGAAGRMVARGGAGVEGSDSFSPLGGGALDSVFSLGGEKGGALIQFPPRGAGGQL